jgi:branched-chain amino acid transport system permease protein
MSNYLLHITIEACVLSTLAVSLNFMAGYCRLVPLGQLTFYAIGSYSAALLAAATPLGYALAIPAALCVAGCVAVVESAATARLKNDEFAIATFAMHIAFWTLLMNWRGLTRGPLGIGDIPPLTLGGYSFDDPPKLVLFAVVLLAVSLLVIFRLKHRPFGFLMRMVRDDEELARNFGRDVIRLRTSVWIVAALIAAMAGLLQASYVGYINPVSFSSMESTVLLAVVILGGVGTFWGPVIGAFVMTCIPEALRFIGLPTAQAANIRQILLGIVLILAAFQMASMRGRNQWLAQRDTLA